MNVTHNTEYTRYRSSGLYLRNLVAHIRNRSLKDDVVCKLSVPDEKTPSQTHEIEVAVTDVIVMLCQARQASEITSRLNDMRDQVRRNSIEQRQMLDSLQALQEEVSKTFNPQSLTKEIVHDLEQGL